MTAAQYAELVAAQNGRCSICDLERELVVDHDHETGAVRGLLCEPCNKALGFLEDSTERLASAILYLTQRQGETDPRRAHNPEIAGSTPAAATSAGWAS